MVVKISDFLLLFFDNFTNLVFALLLELTFELNNMLSFLMELSFHLRFEYQHMLLLIDVIFVDCRVISYQQERLILELNILHHLALLIPNQGFKNTIYHDKL